jgi:hypothetical protein
MGCFWRHSRFFLPVRASSIEIQLAYVPQKEIDSDAQMRTTYVGSVNGVK